MKARPICFRLFVAHASATTMIASIIVHVIKQLSVRGCVLEVAPHYDQSQGESCKDTRNDGNLASVTLN